MARYNVRFSKRQKKAVIRLWKAKGDDPHVLERYCFQVVALFQPWRSYEDLLKNADGATFSTYTEAYEALRQQLPDMQQFESSRARLKEMVEWAEKIQTEVQQKLEASTASGAQQAISSSVGDTVQDLDLELCQCSDKIRAALTEEDVKENYNRLNVAQKEAFDLILQQIRSDVGGSATADQLPSKQVFVSGVGGTGKSFLIMALRHHLEYYYSSERGPAVLVAAPTGVAAANIDGVTVHKLLKLPISKTHDLTSQHYWPLLSQDVKIFRSLFRNAKLLIIDEVSMLSNLYLLFIHKRLNEVLVDEDKTYARFGNLNVLLLGDLLQLPPVNAPHVFQSVTRKQIEGSFKSLGGGLSLWNLFEFVELSENMRQRDDPVYASMLDIIRIGSTESDISLLQKRLIVPPDDADNLEWPDLLPIAVTKFLDMMKEDPYTLCLMPKNESVSSFNGHMMKILNMHVIVCKALDETMMAIGTSSRSKSKKMKKDANTSSKSTRVLTTAETGGLEDELMLAEGARVMLRRNIDVQLKLVNGSIGYVRRFDIDPATSKPIAVAVQFQGVSELTLITRVKVKYYIGGNLFVERSQFPLTHAYAITIHKCQGLSLQSALLDLGSGTFSDGMGYVALSRVKRLSSLHIIQLCSSKLTCQKLCVQEYNRLRKVAGVGAEITRYNLNPELVNLRKKVLVDSEYQKSALREEVGIASRYASAKPSSKPISRKRKKSAAVGGKRTVDSLPILRSYTYLKFRNTDGHSSNAVVQCLLRCKQIYGPLQLYSLHNAVATIMCSFFRSQGGEEKEELQTDGLRDAFGSTSQFSTARAMNCDPVDFVTELILKMPVEVADMFRHFKSLKGSCPRNVCGVENTAQDFEEQYLEIGSPPDVDRYTMPGVFKTRSVRYHRCDACEELCSEFPVEAQYLFPSANKYLILYVPVMNGGQFIGKAMLGVRERGLSLFGQKWNVVASVQTSAPTSSLPSSRSKEFMEVDDVYRHYVAYIHHEEQAWVKLNDTYQMLLRSKPACLRMVLIFLERL